MTASPAPVEIDQETIERELIQRERERRDALVHEDMAAFADLIAEDIVHVHTTGIVHDRAQLLHHAGRFLKFYDVERGALTVRALAQDIAVMTGPMVNVVGRRDTDERLRVTAFVTQLWVRRDGRWQIASFHAVRQDA